MSLKILYTILLSIILFPSTPVMASTFEDVTQEVYFLGDTIDIDALCTKKKSGVSFEIFSNGAWKRAGKVSYIRDKKTCSPSKTYYSAVVNWEVDRIGDVDTKSGNSTAGNLQIRIKANGLKTQYGNIQVWQSQQAKSKVENERGASFSGWLDCINNGGSWDSSRRVCL
jgi:hypothetical protein